MYHILLILYILIYINKCKNKYLQYKNDDKQLNKSAKIFKIKHKW